MNVWAKTRGFSDTEWHWKEKVSCDGWVGFHHAHCLFFRCAVPWSVSLRVISLAVLHVWACAGAPCFVLIASRVVIKVVSPHVQTAFKGAVGG